MPESPHTGDAATEKPSRLARMLLWAERHPIVSILLIVFALATAGLFGLARYGQRQLDAEIAGIVAAKEPLTLEEFVARGPQILDEENRAFRLKEIGARLGKYDEAVENRPDAHKLPIVGTAFPPRAGEKLSPTHLAAAKQYLADHAEQLSAIHLEARRPGGACPAPLLAPYTSFFSEYRAVAKALALEALVAADEQRHASTVAAIGDLYGISGDLVGDPSLLGVLVLLACDDLAFQELFHWINASPSPPDDSVAIAQALPERDYMRLLHHAFLGERAYGFGHYNATYASLTAVLSSPGPATIPQRAIGVLPGVAGLDRAAYLRHMTALCHAVGLSLRTCVAEARRLEAEVRWLPFYCVMTRSFVPHFNAQLLIAVDCIGRQRAARTAFAAERFRMAHGRWPDSMAELVPAYLKDAPVDPFTDQPILVSRNDRGFCVYSVGTDGVDNGGAIDSGSGSCDTGWFLLDPELRGRPPTSQPATAPSH